MTGSQAPYAIKRLTDLEDSAPGLGAGDSQETRFATADLGSEQIGVTHHRFAAGKRQVVGHRHDEAEEVYVVIGGSGRINLNGDIVDLERLDAIRIAPPVMRAFEGGPEGMEVLAFGPRHDGDGEAIEGWWPE
jgi:quercetin dioxygenase-like cupin family protein